MKVLFYFFILLTLFFIDLSYLALAESPSSLESKEKNQPQLKEESSQNKKNAKLDPLNQKTSTSVSSENGIPFSDADPEDITNENFPDLIQSFDYPNTPISEIIKAISKLTNKNFIMDANVGNKKISIIAPTPITVAEAYKVFLTALSMHELTVVPTKDGKFLKIRRTSDATRDSVETYYGEYFPRTDQLITYVFSLKYLSTSEVLGDIKVLLGSKAKIVAHKTTNTLIITDYGSNIDKVKMILKSLDLPGNEEKMQVIPIQHANSEEVANLLNQIFLKSGSRGGSYRSSYSSSKKSRSSKLGADGRKQLSLVLSYSRGNSIIVVGTPSGIRNIKNLIRKLDVQMDESGGIFVYSIRHGEAKKIAEVLNNVISARSEKNGKNQGKAGGVSQRLQRSRFLNRSGLIESSGAPLFSKNLKIIPDESNNNLIITGDRTDHIGIKTLISKIDIPRNQVYLRVIIVDMDVSKDMNWGVNYYGAPAQFGDVKLPTAKGDVNFKPNLGFRSSNMDGLIKSFFGAGVILGFGKESMKITYGGKKYEIGDVLGLVSFLKENTNTTILSRPQVMVMDNEKAEISFGEEIKIGESTTVFQGGNQSQPSYKEAKRQLEFTPFISEETDTIRLVIKQTDDHPVEEKTQGSTTYRFKRRSLNSTIVVGSGDTAVLGGLMSETETDSVTKVPLLGDLPIIGWLFKGSSKSKKKSNIFAFITPKIVRSVQESQDLRKSRMKVLEEDYKILSKKNKETKKIKQLFKHFKPEESISSLNENPLEVEEVEEIEEVEQIEEVEEESNR